MVNFPTSQPSLKNDFDNQDNVGSADQNDSANEVNAIAAKVGIDGSAVTTSHDYKLSGVTGSDKAVSKTGTETLTNKTLTSPVLNAFTGTGGTITVPDNNNTVGLTVTQNDVTNNPNAITVTNAGAGNGIYINQTGVLASTAALYVYSNAAQTSAVLSQFTMDNASSNQTVIGIHNDGTGRGLYIDQNGNGVALKIDNAGTNFGIYLNQTGALANGDYGVLAHSETAQTTNARFVQIKLGHASSTCDCVGIQNDGTGNCLFIDQNGDAYAINIDSEATTKPSINIASAINNDGAPFSIKDAVGANAYFQIGRNDNVTDKIVLRLGRYYFWVDATGDFRLSSGNPPNDTSGTVVGTQS